MEQVQPIWADQLYKKCLECLNIQQLDIVDPEDLLEWNILFIDEKHSAKVFSNK